MAAPLTKEEREHRRCSSKDIWDEGKCSSMLLEHALGFLRYEATVRDLESERDGLQDEVRELRALLDAIAQGPPR